MATLKQKINWMLERLTGYALVKAPPDYIRWLRSQRINTIIDVGANEGQFVESIRRYFPEAVIHSFEPLPEVFAPLKYRFAHDKRLIVHNCALGDRTGTAELYHNSFSPSSSLLPMHERHVEAFPHTGHATRTTITLKRLDDLFEGMETTPPILLKIDVQGAESAVLEGAVRTLGHVLAVIMELSYTELYVGQKLRDEMVAMMEGYGFMYAGDIEYLSDSSGRRLQADGLFVRPKAYR